MASYFPPNILTFKADGAIAQGKVVKPGSDDQHVVVSAAATSKNMGIAHSVATLAEDLIEIAMPGGGCKVLLGAGGCAVGDLLTSDASGTLVVTTTPGDRYVAMALEAGSAGEMVSAHAVAGLI